MSVYGSLLQYLGLKPGALNQAVLHVTEEVFRIRLSFFGDLLIVAIFED